MNSPPTPARYWALSEPGPEVTHVVDHCGYLWSRADSARSGSWTTEIGGKLDTRTWVALLVTRGPLVDATDGERAP